MTDQQASGPIATALRDGTIAPSAPGAFVTSLSIGKIAEALANAQAEIQQPVKSAENPYYNSRYAPLDVVWNAARIAFAKHGIAVVQSPTYEVIDLVTSTKEKADGTAETTSKKYGVVTVVTLLAHKSGEWIRGTHYALADQIGPQGAQSALTYARRGALSAMTGVTPQNEDDDGEAAVTHEDPNKPSATDIDTWGKSLSVAARSGTEALRAAWDALPPESHIKMAALKDALKTKAQAADKKNEKDKGDAVAA